MLAIVSRVADDSSQTAHTAWMTGMSAYLPAGLHLDLAESNRQLSSTVSSQPSNPPARVPASIRVSKTRTFP
jgi:hypothetical protein